eukprot:511559_1
MAAKTIICRFEEPTNPSNDQNYLKYIAWCKPDYRQPVNTEDAPHQWCIEAQWYYLEEDGPYWELFKIWSIFHRMWRFICRLLVLMRCAYCYRINDAICVIGD